MTNSIRTRSVIMRRIIHILILIIASAIKSDFTRLDGNDYAASSSIVVQVDGGIHRHMNYTLYPMKLEHRPSPLAYLAAWKEQMAKKKKLPKVRQSKVEEKKSTKVPVLKPKTPSPSSGAGPNPDSNSSSVRVNQSTSSQTHRRRVHMLNYFRGKLKDSTLQPAVTLSPSALAESSVESSSSSSSSDSSSTSPSSSFLTTVWSAARRLLATTSPSTSTEGVSASSSNDSVDSVGVEHVRSEFHGLCRYLREHSNLTSCNETEWLKSWRATQTKGKHGVSSVNGDVKSDGVDPAELVMLEQSTTIDVNSNDTLAQLFEEYSRLTDESGASASSIHSSSEPVEELDDQDLWSLPSDVNTPPLNVHDMTYPFDIVPITLYERDVLDEGGYEAEVPKSLGAKKANVSVHKLNMYNMFPASISHVTRMQNGHFIRLENPHNHFSFHPPVGGCNVTLPEGGLEHTSSNARRNKCRVATNAGFFNIAASPPAMKSCYNGLIVRNGTFIQKQHTRFRSQQFTRNVHFGLTSHGHFFIGYLDDDLWSHHLRKDSRLPKDIDDRQWLKDEAKRLESERRHRIDAEIAARRAAKEAREAELAKKMAALREEREKKEQAEAIARAKADEKSEEVGRLITGDEHEEDKTHSDGTTVTTGTHPTAYGNVRYRLTRSPRHEAKSSWRRLLAEAKAKAELDAGSEATVESDSSFAATVGAESESESESKSELDSERSRPTTSPYSKPIEYVPLDSDGDWYFNTLLGGVLWLVRDGRNYIEQSLRDGEDLTVERSPCPWGECGPDPDISGGPGTSSYKRSQHFIHLTSARTAIGHTIDGALVILSVDGKTDTSLPQHVRSIPGINLHDLAELLIRFGVLNAMNLDGGGSATVVVDGNIANYPSDSIVWPANQYPDVTTHFGVREVKSSERLVSTITCIYDDEDENEPLTGSTSSTELSSLQSALLAAQAQLRAEEDHSRQIANELEKTRAALAASIAGAGKYSSVPSGSKTPVHITTINSTLANTTLAINMTEAMLAAMREAQSIADAQAAAYERGRRRGEREQTQSGPNLDDYLDRPGAETTTRDDEYWISLSKELVALGAFFLILGLLTCYCWKRQSLSNPSIASLSSNGFARVRINDTSLETDLQLSLDDPHDEIDEEEDDTPSILTSAEKYNPNNSRRSPPSSSPSSKVGTFLPKTSRAAVSTAFAESSLDEVDDLRLDRNSPTLRSKQSIGRDCSSSSSSSSSSPSMQTHTRALARTQKRARKDRAKLGRGAVEEMGIGGLLAKDEANEEEVDDPTNQVDSPNAAPSMHVNLDAIESTSNNLAMLPAVSSLTSSPSKSHSLLGLLSDREEYDFASPPTGSPV